MTMITIFLILNVNIQYLLHFQIALFLLYFFAPPRSPLQTNALVPISMTIDLCKARTSRRRYSIEMGESHLTYTQKKKRFCSFSCIITATPRCYECAYEKRKRKKRQFLEKQPPMITSICSNSSLALKFPFFWLAATN